MDTENRLAVVKGLQGWEGGIWEGWTGGLGLVDANYYIQNGQTTTKSYYIAQGTIFNVL